MAPLPANGTARCKITYETCDFNHTVQIRFNEPDTIDDVITEFNNLTTALDSQFYLSTFIEASSAVVLSDVFNPAVGAWPTTWGSVVGDGEFSAYYMDFIGRSLDARRTRFALFGCKVAALGGRFRATAAADAPVNDAISILNGAEGTFLTINGFQPVWKEYANLGPNAYWRNKIR